MVVFTRFRCHAALGPYPIAVAVCAYVRQKRYVCAFGSLGDKETGTTFLHAAERLDFLASV